MKKFLITAATFVALATPAMATDIDNGVAATLVYAEACNSSDIPPQVKNMTEVYFQARSEQVKSEMKNIMLTITSTGIDSDTAVKLWCSLMRPKLIKIFNQTSQ